MVLCEPGPVLLMVLAGAGVLPPPEPPLGVVRVADVGLLVVATVAPPTLGAVWLLPKLPPPPPEPPPDPLLKLGVWLVLGLLAVRADTPPPLPLPPLMGGGVKLLCPHELVPARVLAALLIVIEKLAL